MLVPSGCSGKMANCLPVSRIHMYIGDTYCMILTTYFHVHVHMQFYIAESSLEVLARHMMFLSLISEPLDKLGLQGELYISTLLVSQCTMYVILYYLPCGVQSHSGIKQFGPSCSLKVIFTGLLAF